jgi:DNA-binding GntR family transcriptional regulator
MNLEENYLKRLCQNTTGSVGHQLEREGLVEIIPRVGTCVTKPTEKELTELFTLKGVMEGLAASLLAESRDPSKISEVRQAIASMEKAVETSDHKLYVEANNIFHIGIDSRYLSDN